VTVRGEGRDQAVADALVALLHDRGAAAIADHADVRRWSGSLQAVRAGIEHFGRLDGIVNNAGILRPADIADVSNDDFDAEIGVHLKGTFGCLRHACEYWRDENRAGRRPNAAVVNINRRA
jgi:NAD(P)-dependent dehydrogenase (short-subunit alcohol dehydrogenase family)